MYPCELQERAEQPTLAIRTRSSIQDLPTVLGTAYNAIMSRLVELGEQPAGPPFVAYHNMDMENLDLEIGLPVARPLAAAAPIFAGSIPGGAMATCLYTGPYDGIGAGYDTLTQWVRERGHTPTGVAYEWYLNDPEEVAPAELQTLIGFPLG